MRHGVGRLPSLLFAVSGMEYGHQRMLEEMEGEDARRVTLETLARSEKAKFLYEYDFGDR